MSHTEISPPAADWMERALLQRYLARTLSAQETDWFEAWMLDKPHIIAAIEADNDLRDGLALASAARSGAAVMPRRAPAAGRRHRPVLAWAASVVTALGLGLILGGPLSLRADGGDTLIASPERVVFDTLRGTEAPPLRYRGAAESRHVLIEVGLPPDAENIILHLDGLAPQSLVLSPDGFVSFVLPRTLLRSEPAPRVEYVLGGARVSRTLVLPDKP